MENVFKSFILCHFNDILLVESQETLFTLAQLGLVIDVINQVKVFAFCFIATNGRCKICFVAAMAKFSCAWF